MEIRFDMFDCFLSFPNEWKNYNFYHANESNCVIFQMFIKKTKEKM